MSLIPPQYRAAASIAAALLFVAYTGGVYWWGRTDGSASASTKAESKANAIAVKQYEAAASATATSQIKTEAAKANQSEVLHVLQTQTISIATGTDAAAVAAVGRLRILAARSGAASGCAVPKGASAASGSDAGQATVAGQLSDANRSDLVAVGAASDKVIAERQALLTACRGLLREAWRATN